MKGFRKGTLGHRLDYVGYLGFCDSFEHTFTEDEMRAIEQADFLGDNSSSDPYEIPKQALGIDALNDPRSCVNRKRR